MLMLGDNQASNLLVGVGARERVADLMREQKRDGD